MSQDEPGNAMSGARVEVDDFAWPEARLDPVAKMRALAAGLPHVAVRETVLHADYDRVWNFISDLENNTARYELAVSQARIIERAGERIRLESRMPFGIWLGFDVVLRPGWCLMRSRVGEIGMAAQPEGSTRTRLIHFEGSRLFGRLARPYFRWNIAGDFRRLGALLE